MTAAPALAAEFPAATEAQWRALVEKSLAGVPFERALVARTRDGFALPALAARDSSAETLAPARGAAPWGIAARVDHPEAEAANALALADLEGGADQLVLVGAGAASARGFGLPLFDPAVLARVLAGVEVDLIALRLEPGADALSDALALADHLVARRLVPADLDVDFGLPLETPWDEAVSFVREAIGRGFRGPFLAADGRAIHEAGGTDAQELAVLLAILAERMRILTDAGLSDTAARSAIGFTLVVDADQLGGMAKLRAFRRLLARFDRACGLVPAPTRLHVETAWRSLSRTDAYVNTLRATIAAFAAGTGGADSLCVLPFTQAVGLPDGAARRLARNTSLVLQSECHLHRMVDPAAGSGAIEALTDALAAESWRLFQGLDREARAAGGVRAALDGGDFAAALRASGDALRRAVATGAAPLTGTSRFPNPSETPPEVLRPAPPGATGRLSEPFEALRERAVRAKPAVFLANLGRIGEFTPRATFAKGAFEAGGIAALGNDGFANTDGATDLHALAAAFQASGARFACLCSSDAVYATEGAAALAALGAAGADTVFLAGKPGEWATGLRFDGHLAAGMDLPAFLDAVLTKAGA